MQSFDELSRDERIQLYRQFGLVALERYGIRQPYLEFRSESNCVVFYVEAETGRFALRIHPPYYTTSQIESELRWLVALCRNTDLLVSVPVPATDGALIQAVEIAGIPRARECTLLRWVEGEFFDKELTPNHLRQVGMLTARIHDHADAFAKSEKNIERWESLPITSIPTWISGDPVKTVFSESDLQTFTAAAERVISSFHQIEENKKLALIHGDIHQWNYLFHYGEVGIIDFDACCWSHHVNDLAITLYHLGIREDLPVLHEALLDGYAKVRPLPNGYEDQLKIFQIHRHLGIVEWVLSSPHLDWRNQFLQSAAKRCKRYLNQ